MPKKSSYDTALSRAYKREDEFIECSLCVGGKMKPRKVVSHAGTSPLVYINETYYIVGDDHVARIYK